MTAPPPYPRTPYLWPPPQGASGDRLLPPAEAARWLTEPVVVEEKLDGANVSLWTGPADGIHVASRGGPGAMDRAGQLGRLRAWAAERSQQLTELLTGGWAAYGEWLWLRHGTAYDALPDWLIVLDLWHPVAGFARLEERDRRASIVDLPVPPRRFAGTLRSEGALLDLLGRSAYATGSRAEGLLLRAVDGRRCKVLDPAHRRPSDQDWRSGARNSLRVEAGSMSLQKSPRGFEEEGVH